ncbi:hypothetical protein Bca4012_027486 [Brassica carinata]
MTSTPSATNQTRVINFVEKDISEMWPKWDSEVEDVPAENIIKVMYDRRPWKWTKDCWEVTGTKKAKEIEMVVVEEEEDNPRPLKKARKGAPKEAPKGAPKEAPKEAPTEASEEAREEASWVTREELENMFKDVVDCMKEGFKKCIKEIRKLSDRVEAVEKKVGVTNQPTPLTNQTTPQEKQPTPQTKQPTPQTKQPTPQTKKPTPQKKQPTPQTKQTTPRAKTTTPQAKQSEREIRDEANSGNKILPEDKADGVSSKEIVAVTSTDQPSVASTDQQPSVASTDQQPSVASTDQQSSVASTVSKPSLVVLDKTAPTASVRARSERAKKPAPTQISPYTAEKKRDKVAAYNLFQPVNRPKLKELAGWLKTDPHYFTKHDEKPRTSPTWWYHILRTAREWLEDCHIDAWINVLRQRYQENPQAFRSERMCFLDHNFSQSWRDQYQFFKVSVPDHKGLGRALPGGAWNYYDGSIPSFCQSNKVWGEDIDDIYALVNLNNAHWVAIWISIPKRHIVVWDSIPSSMAAEAWDEIMLPFIEMVPYLLVECAATDEIRVKYGLEPYTYERQLQDVPTANNGDCGVYALKHIECHALGVPFNSKDFTRTNAKNTRDKMAVDIWTELLDQHLKENVDGDKFVGMYD